MTETRRAFGTVARRLLCSVAVMLSIVVPAAHAQTITSTATSTTTATTTATTTTTTTTTASSSTSSEGGPDTSATNDVVVAIAILLLGGTAVLLAYVFYDRWRSSFQTLAQAALQKTGALPVVEFNPVENAQFRGRDVAPEAAQQQPVIKGPSTVIVGDPVVFRATVGDAAAANCTWAVDPPGSAAIDPASGPQTTLTAAAEGPIKLSATVAGGGPTYAQLTAVAKSGGGVPLLGSGFAGTAAAIVAFAVAGALTALGDLSGAAFIAFLGPVVGYFFAQSRDSSGGGGSGGQSAGSGTAK